MAARLDKWVQIEAAYRGGMSLSSICDRFGVRMRELIVRVGEGSWKRDAKADPAPAADGPGAGSDERHEPEKHLPVVIDEAVSAAAAEAVGDIVNAHKSITRRLRERFDSELAEFDESAKYMAATFRDEAHIKSLLAKDDGGRELRAYLTQCLAHQTKRTEGLEKLSRIGGQIVNLERAVWGFESGDDGAATYEDLLERIQSAQGTRRELPNHVIDFEKRLAQLRSRSGHD